MKVLVLLVLLILLFVLLSVTGAANRDLTPEFAAAPAAAAPVPAADAQVFAPAEQQIITIQNTTPGLAEVPDPVVVPVTGSCTDPYIVQQGDNLSTIANLCGSTVGNIRLANPQITNINMIYPGMVLRIPGGGSPAQPVEPVPVTGGKDPWLFPTATPTQSTAPGQPWPTATPTTAADPGQPLPTETLAPYPSFMEPDVLPNTEDTAVFRAGTQMTVRANNLPPNTPVVISIGPAGGEIRQVGTGITDDGGNLAVNITVPEVTSAAALPHVVVITATTPPNEQIISPPFFIANP